MYNKETERCDLLSNEVTSRNISCGSQEVIMDHKKRVKMLIMYFLMTEDMGQTRPQCGSENWTAKKRHNIRHTDVAKVGAKKANISISDRDVGMVEGKKQRLKYDGSEGEAMNAGTLEVNSFNTGPDSIPKMSLLSDELIEQKSAFSYPQESV